MWKWKSSLPALPRDAEFFPGMPSRISGIGLSGIEKKVLELHGQAWREDVVTLPIGGLYRYRRGGEHHAWEAGLIHTLQEACNTDSYSTYKEVQRGLAKPAADIPPCGANAG